MNKRQIEERAEAMIGPIALENGVSVYDVEYVREAGEYFLRCFIDKEGGVTIDHCVSVNHAMSKALDEADFIDEAYTLEVSSKGLGRALTKDRHFAQEIGSEVDVKLYQAVDGKKLFRGVLESFDRDSITVRTAEESRVFARKEIASVKLTLDL
ncbi:MAG: ribosome maturation factor RimP [Lachnospiraceae bacterium]|nr:ribosome maturation factor RimP [Lachnospiraceae bacterium]